MYKDHLCGVSKDDSSQFNENDIYSCDSGSDSASDYSLG